MNQEIALWALGIAFAVIGGLGVYVLNGVRESVKDTNEQAKDTNAKVSALSTDYARINESHTGLTRRVDALDAWRAEEQSRQLHEAQARIAELLRERESDRREGPPERRGT